MAEEKKNTRKGVTRRTLLTGAAAAAVLGGAGVWLGSVSRVSRSAGKKVIIIGIDGMDPRLSASMMAAGELPNLAKLRAAGGFSKLGTSTPPQSPVAWANFINGAGPGSHGIFDFIHRHPEAPTKPFYGGAETLPGGEGWDIGEHTLHLDFWPFNHTPPTTVLRRQGTPFWDYLDAAGIPSTFYDLPSNYPASPSHHGHHRCICGMGTPDVLGTYGTYHYFAENNPAEPSSEEGGKRIKLTFEGDTAEAQLTGPDNSLLRTPKPVYVDFLVHRDRDANAAVIEVQEKRLALRQGQWSRWVKLDFEMEAPWFVPNQHVSGICRFYLQQVRDNLRLYVSPINIDPAAPAVPISEPKSFTRDVAERIGPFYTVGFQEDHKARSNGIFDDAEYLRQATMVLDGRLALWGDALQNYDDGLLFFYFSSSDLQSHMFWWEGDERHPSRSRLAAKACHNHVRALYRRLDRVIGDLYDRYGSSATIIVMSDHGFANFGRQFNVNSWLRDMDYIRPRECSSIMHDVDWAETDAYGLGINGLYLNLKGREPHGKIDPGEEADNLLTEISNRLMAVRDNGKPVIRGVYRSSRIYTGSATALAPDLIIGYHRGYRASWDTCLGGLSEDTISDNTAAWSADHCADALEVPGVLWCNHKIEGNPSLIDIAPSILADYGLERGPGMTGRNVFG